MATLPPAAAWLSRTSASIAPAAPRPVTTRAARVRGCPNETRAVATPAITRGTVRITSPVPNDVPKTLPRSTPASLSSRAMTRTVPIAASSQASGRTRLTEAGV